MSENGTLDPEEHAARAMLMGRSYVRWASAYASEQGWVDAHTLEPLPLEVIYERIDKSLDAEAVEMVTGRPMPEGDIKWVKRTVKERVSEIHRATETRNYRRR